MEIIRTNTSAVNATYKLINLTPEEFVTSAGELADIVRPGNYGVGSCVRNAASNTIDLEIYVD